jgi:hypothetical protein
MQASRRRRLGQANAVAQAGQGKARQGKARLFFIDF